MPYSLGVDLGTTFVGAAVAHGPRVEMFTLGDRTVVTPAVVYARDDDTIVTGEAANRRAVSNPDRLGREIKRRLGDPTPVMLGGAPHAVTALLAALLSDTVSRVTATEGAPPDHVVLTHPANWGPYRRELFEEVPHLAGVAQATMLTEPEAAAAHYAATRHLTDGDTVAVYDLGGGTFDATVLRKHGIGIDILGTPEGIERLGGVDFDDAVLAHINYSSGGALSELDLSNPQTAVALARLRQDAIAAKEALSVDTETTVPVFLPHRHFDVRLTRTEFEDMIRAQVESTIGALTRTLRSAGVAPHELDAVLLVGGSSRIPLTSRMITEALDRPTLIDAHPKYAVALGAAALATEVAPDVVGPGHGTNGHGAHDTAGHETGGNGNGSHSGTANGGNGTDTGNGNGVAAHATGATIGALATAGALTGDRAAVGGAREASAFATAPLESGGVQYDPPVDQAERETADSAYTDVLTPPNGTPVWGPSEPADPDYAHGPSYGPFGPYDDTPPAPPPADEAPVERSVEPARRRSRRGLVVMAAVAALVLLVGVIGVGLLRGTAAPTPSQAIVPRPAPVVLPLPRNGPWRRRRRSPRASPSRRPAGRSRSDRRPASSPSRRTASSPTSPTAAPASSRSSTPR